MSAVDKDLVDLAKSTTEDLYALLGVAHDSSEQDIKKAYRKASIKYHPDKNPDNKDAADRFIYLGWARDILITPELKGEYDRARTRRREKALQDELLNGRRRTMKEDLERREREGREKMGNLKRKRAEEMNEHEKREEEIRRLAEDGKRRRKEAQDRIAARLREEQELDNEQSSFLSPVQPPRPGTTSDLSRTVKIRFQRAGATADWDKEKLRSLFAKYGPIDSIIMAKDKKVRVEGSKHRYLIASAFVIYTRLDHAHAAVLDAPADVPALESVEWADGEPDLSSHTANLASSTTSSASTTPTAPHTPSRPSFRSSFGPKPSSTTTPLGTPKFSFSPRTPSLEEHTMMRLKAAEKKRLEDKIRREEAALDEGV